MCKHILIRNFTHDDIPLIDDFIARTYDDDGFGAIMRLKGGGIRTAKSLDLGSFYLDVGRWIQAGVIEELVLHHRTSTNESGIDYAHPFEFNGHYLTHNGVVNVPGKHDTKTKNDSEALLHHLIKTNYETQSIAGYFSCFILNDQETIVLVDDSAPIYTDGRVYCSHGLDSLTKIELQKIVHRSDGTTTKAAIEVSKSSYGADKRHLSLGSDQAHDFSAYETQEAAWYDDNDADDDSIFFLDSLYERDIARLEACRTVDDFLDEVKRICEYQGITMTEAQVNRLVRYFDFGVRYRA
jgi:hypothetical protein